MPPNRLRSMACRLDIDSTMAQSMGSVVRFPVEPKTLGLFPYDLYSESGSSFRQSIGVIKSRRLFVDPIRGQGFGD